MVCWFVWFIWFVLFFWFLGCVWLRNFVRDFDTGSFLPDKLEKAEKPKRRFLIQHADEPAQRAFRQRIIRVQRERFLVAFDGLLPLSLALVDIDGLLQLSLHLVLVGLLEKAPGLLFVFLSPFTLNQEVLNIHIPDILREWSG